MKALIWIGLITLTTISQMISQAARGQSTDTRERPAVCNVEHDDDAVLRCYLFNYRSEVRANDLRHRHLIARAKNEFEGLSDDNVAESETLAAFVHKANLLVTSQRKHAALDCVRMAAKIHSSSTSLIGAVNCRTSHELELSVELRKLEQQLQMLSTTPRT